MIVWFGMAETRTSSVSRRAGRSALSLNALHYVSRRGDSATPFAFDVGKRHLDVKFASALVQRAGQRGAPLKLHGDPLSSPRRSLSSVRLADARNDQIEPLTER